MLTFYPEFEAETPPEVEVVFLLDLSCSMKVSSSVVFFLLVLDVVLLGGATWVCGGWLRPYVSCTTGVCSGMELIIPPPLRWRYIDPLHK